MGVCKRFIYNEQLMNAADYSSPSRLKILIRQYEWLEKLAKQGDTVAHAILLDIKTVLGMSGDKHKVVTPKQRKVLIDVLIHDALQEEVAEEMGISQQAVSLLLMTGLRRISRYLTTGKTGKRYLTEKEKNYLVRHYHKLPVHERVHTLLV